MAVSNAQTPKRERAANRDEKFPKRRCATYRMVADVWERNPPMELGDAIGRALTHWPAFEDLHGMAPNTPSTQDDVFNDMIFASLPVRLTFTRNSRTDPMSRA